MLCFSKNGIQLQRNFQVCHTVAAKWLVFHEKSKDYINNPRNCRFSGRETSKMHLGTQKGVLGSLMEHRKWKRKRQRASK